MASQHLSELYPTAFLTGASAGLGRAFAEMLLAEGVRVWGTSRDGARLTELASRYPTLFTPVVYDLLDTGLAPFERAQKSAGGVFDLVIANAGYGIFGPFDTTELAVWERQVEALLLAHLRLSHAALRAMRAHQRGCLVNVSSLAVEFPLPYMSGYNVAKAGLAALSESLMIETRGTGITVIELRPGDFRTDFNQAMQSVSASALSPESTLGRAWSALEANLRTSPLPVHAAADLRRALRRRRSGTVRTGSWFQARLAPSFAGLLPARWRRALAARYFGL